MIYRANIEDIWMVQKVAHHTWPQTFKEILSDRQLYYMLDMMYSTNSLKRQMENGVLFDIYLGANQKDVVGFVGFKHYSDTSTTKIHKLYVIPTYQGQSIGKTLMTSVNNSAKIQKMRFISLNVNRFNKAVSFYEKLGFSIDKVEDIDIGNGYLMEDFVMSKIIK